MGYKEDSIPSFLAHLERSKEMSPPKDRDTRYTENGNHRTWYDGNRNSRISWDVDQNSDYVPGSGHEVDQDRGKVVDRWDPPDKK